MVDFPNSTKSKKFYLCIDAGGSMNHEIVMIEGHKEVVKEDQVDYMKKLR